MYYNVVDNLLPKSLVRAAEAEWPIENWPWWMQYNSVDSVKRASRCRDEIPFSCQLLLNKLAELDIHEYIGGTYSFPDLTLYGAGLHEISPKGFLSRHLDSTHHPITKWKRIASVVLFINSEWKEDWGGELKLWNGERVLPKQGRVIIMATTDTSFHEVLPVTGPEARKTLAMFWWNIDKDMPEKVRYSATYTRQ